MIISFIIFSRNKFAAVFLKHFLLEVSQTIIFGLIFETSLCPQDLCARVNVNCTNTRHSELSIHRVSWSDLPTACNQSSTMYTIFECSQNYANSCANSDAYSSNNLRHLHLLLAAIGIHPQQRTYPLASQTISSLFGLTSSLHEDLVNKLYCKED